MFDKSSDRKDDTLLALEGAVEGHMMTSPADFVSVEAVVNLESSVLTAYASTLFSNLENAVLTKGGKMTFTEEELLTYLQSLIASRIAYVLHKDVIIRPQDDIVVPSYLMVVINNIGKVTDNSLGVEIVPAFVKSPLSKEEIQSFSRKLVAYGNFGFEYGTGFARDKYGSWDFMAMTVVEDEVMRHDDAPHLVYALMAATIGLKGIEAALSPRVRYGNVNHIESLVSSLATLK